MTFYRVAALLLGITFIHSSFAAEALPLRYTELNQYAVKGPSQGDANTCLFMASTAAMEILLGKASRQANPQELGPTDLSERYLVSMYNLYGSVGGYWFEDAFLLFNTEGSAVLAQELPFEAYDEYGDENVSVWYTPDNFYKIPRIKIPKVETEYLFSVGNRYSKNVLDESHVLQVKEALVRTGSPIITVGNDEEYWHVTVITGYDDDATDGNCYELAGSVCKGKKGAFYVRDSFGLGVEKRSYEWFIRRQNSASVAKFK